MYRLEITMHVFPMFKGVSHFFCFFVPHQTISFQSMQLKIRISSRVYYIFLKAKLYLIFTFPDFIYAFEANLILLFHLKKTSLSKREHWRFSVLREKLRVLIQIKVSLLLTAYYVIFEFPDANS